mmetsp:Transcript_11883/g.55204  ORF Transcript_11883/g.55204 Transcript_11883/m.55204 type:complete len:209 (-) Transcript_11883:1648-2274(-)
MTSISPAGTPPRPIAFPVKGCRRGCQPRCRWRRPSQPRASTPRGGERPRASTRSATTTATTKTAFGWRLPVPGSTDCSKRLYLRRSCRRRLRGTRGDPCACYLGCSPATRRARRSNRGSATAVNHSTRRLGTFRWKACGRGAWPTEAGTPASSRIVPSRVERARDRATRATSRTRTRRRRFPRTPHSTRGSTRTEATGIQPEAIRDHS